MADRENVLKGLECLITNETPCEGCPYNESGYCVKNIAKDARELLQEQDAVPVIQREVMHMLVWCCGSCGVAITDGDKFCRMCGKAVKWDD